jgi:hypothetical protein
MPDGNHYIVTRYFHGLRVLSLKTGNPWKRSNVVPSILAKQCETEMVKYFERKQKIYANCKTPRLESIVR